LLLGLVLNSLLLGKPLLLHLFCREPNYTHQRQPSGLSSWVDKQRRTRLIRLGPFLQFRNVVVEFLCAPVTFPHTALSELRIVSLDEFGICGAEFLDECRATNAYDDATRKRVPKLACSVWKEQQKSYTPSILSHVPARDMLLIVPHACGQGQVRQ
jgi:hypothetical protein